MPLVSVAEVQQWLEPTKMTVTAVDVELDATATSIVFGRLANVYDVSGWVTAASTPTLVRKIISMLVASWSYNRQYSEDNGENEWANKLEAWANTLMGQVSSGDIDITEVEGTLVGQPSFWPNDTTEVGDPNSAAKFVMGASW